METSDFLIVDCESCGKEFLLLADGLAALKNGSTKHVCCSEKCKGKMETPVPPDSVMVTCDHCGKEYLLCPSGVAGIEKGSLKHKFCSDECWLAFDIKQGMLNAVDTTAPAN